MTCLQHLFLSGDQDYDLVLGAIPSQRIRSWSMFKDMSKIMRLFVWMVTYLRRNVTIMWHVLPLTWISNLSWDSKIRFDFKSNLTSAIGNFSKSQHWASYVSRHNAMAYDIARSIMLRHTKLILVLYLPLRVYYFLMCTHDTLWGVIMTSVDSTWPYFWLCLLFLVRSARFDITWWCVHTFPVHHGLYCLFETWVAIVLEVIGIPTDCPVP